MIAKKGAMFRVIRAMFVVQSISGFYKGIWENSGLGVWAGLGGEGVILTVNVL